MSTKANAFKNNFMYSPNDDTPPFCGQQKASTEEQTHYTITKIKNTIEMSKFSKRLSDIKIVSFFIHCEWKVRHLTGLINQRKLGSIPRLSHPIIKEKRKNNGK